MKLAERIRSSNTAYFNAGLTAGGQKIFDLFFVALYESGLVRSPARAEELFSKMHDLEREYGVAWQGRPESDEAIERIDHVLQKVFGQNFQPFFERNDTIKDWWDR